MIIAHYLNHAHRANGHVAVAVDLACEQADRGHEVHFVSGACDFVDVLQRHGVRWHEVREIAGAARMVRMAGDLVPVFRSIGPDIVNAHMVAAALAAKLVQPFFRFRLVTTVHNSFDRQASLMRVGDRVLAVSDAVAEEMARRWIPRRKLRVVRNGTIGGARRPPRPAGTISLQHPAITTVAGLHPRKGIADLLAAFERVFARRPDAHLYLVGDGPMRAAYEAQAAAQPGAANIHFVGHMDDPREVLATTEIFALASHHEPFGLVLAEARQMGCALVASDVGGIPEALWQGRKGVLVPPRDPVRLAEALLDLLDHDDKRLSLAAAARSDLDDITVQRMSADTVAVYEELLGPRAASASGRVKAW